MKEINTQVTTYDPEVYCPESPEAFCVMEVVEDGTGDYVYILEHERLVREFQQRIIYLENCLDEANQMLCR